MVLWRKKDPFMWTLILMLTLAGTFAFGGWIQATSPPGVVDIFVTTSAYSYIETYTLESPFMPNVGAVKTVYVNGRVTDGDGVGTGFADGDLNYVELRLYRENAGAGCTPDVNDCYKTFCSVTPNSSTVLNYSCTVDVSYIADSTMTGGTHPNEAWNAEVIVQDDTAQLASSIKQFEVNTLLALLIPVTLDFGTLLREQSTTAQTNVEYLLTQNGNDVVDVRLSGIDMTCSVNGTIPVSNLRFALTDVGFTDPSVVSVGTTPANAGLTIGTDDDVGLTASLFFNIALPSVVSGVCTGTLTVEAVSV